MILSRWLIFLFIVSLAGCAGLGKEPVNNQPSGENLHEASRLNTELGIGYIKRHQYNVARDKLKKAIDQNSENISAYKSLAYLYSILGLKDKAREQYEKALDIKPENPDTLNSYGVFLCGEGEFDKAQKRFRQAYSNPFYRSIYLAESNAGSCYIKQGKYARAEALLRKSLRIQPRFADSLLSMAELGIKTGKYLMARAYVERYHAIRKPSATSLWIQVQEERALGDKETYMKYARQLIQDFPDSDEAGLVEAQAQARHEQLR